MEILFENSYVKLGIAALLPVIAAVILYILDKKTPFGKIKNIFKQIIFGIIFGGLAIIGTEWGIPMNGAQVNCRDAAVLTAGLMFGAPAGIIAGIIGGVERYIAVAWGIGTFTQIACSVSTIIAGFYGAGLRKFMFENKKPAWLISFAVGIVMEVFHLTMVFITNMSDTDKAMAVVKACTIPMVAANGISVMITSFVLSIFSTEKRIKNKNVKISQTVQRWLLVTIIIAFGITTYFVFSLQNRMADEQLSKSLDMSLEEVSEDIKDASDANLVNIAQLSAIDYAEGATVNDIAAKYSLAEVNIVDKSGTITESTAPEFVGFSMSSDAQASAFMCLLWGSKTYVQEFGPISYDNSISRKYAGASTDTGFIQVGYDEEGVKNDIADEVVGITKNRHVGSDGYVVILDDDSKVVSAPSSVKKEVFKENKVAEQPSGEIFTLTIFDKLYYCKTAPVEKYHIVSVMPEEEAYQMRNIALYVNAFMEILVFALLFALIYQLIKKVVVDRIKSVNESLGRITKGNLDEVVNVRSNEEFASLSDDINSTVDTLKNYIAEAAARIDKELEFAKNIQSSALPSVFPAFPQRNDFDIFASMNPAKEVGGDFYDFYLTNNDTQLNFLIADVSGKGIPAALFMMRAKTELKSLTEAGMPLNEVFTKGNAELCEGNDAGMFVTAWQGGLDLKTGLLRFANAGHNPPLIRHADGQFEYLRTRAGFVLAGMDGVNYKIQEYQMDPGDIIYVYTDGITEATDLNNELYGEDRLLAAINSQEFANVQEMCKYIKADADAFFGEAPQFDDMTMLAVKYSGPQEDK